MFKKNDWQLRKYRRLANKIANLEDSYRQKTDAELQQQTKLFRERLAAGEKLNNLLVEAYATVREADRRVLGMFPYYNQVLGATILNDRNIAEMATGEGKTLTATMPLYLNGLLGAGTFLVTTNDYLANRDAEEMGQVYRWLGLTVASGAAEDLSDEEAAAVYQADIVYTTNSALGFDYLLDNLASDPTAKKQGAFRYALVDEVDSVLLDLSQTPLVIAGAPKLQSNLFFTTDEVVKSLTEDEDYEMSEDQKEVWFTPEGIKKIAKYFGLETLLDPKNKELYRHLVLALQANHLYTLNRDYVVSDGKLVLLDIQDGREMTGIHLEAGMHQALEAKEHLELSDQQRTMASVTYQNLFMMFTKLAGMTGTAATDSREFIEVYNLAVIGVPPHKPNIRVDQPDQLYANLKEKLYASLEVIQEAHAREQPVLIETGSVSLSELYSLMLLENGIAHNVLNAKSAAREAQIIKEAGQLGAVTVATSMAGRGTDIKLGPNVPEKGGLLVVGTERMDSRRVDNQLRGRAGRQGDPGQTKFYLALDDRVVIENGPKNLAKKQQKLTKQLATGRREINQPLKNKRLKRLVKNAQKRAASDSRAGRQGSVQYDDVLLTQQNFIYRFREQLMGYDLEQLLNLVKQINHQATAQLLATPELTLEMVVDYLNNRIDYDFIVDAAFLKLWEAQDGELAAFINDLFQDQLMRQLNFLDATDQQEYFLRLTILHALDNAWIEQVDNLHQLRAVISKRSMAQHDPVSTFQLEAVRGFKQMKILFWQLTVTNVALTTLSAGKNGEIQVEFP